MSYYDHDFWEVTTKKCETFYPNNRMNESTHLKKVLNESSPPPMVLSDGIWPSGWIPCSCFTHIKNQFKKRRKETKRHNLMSQFDSVNETIYYLYLNKSVQRNITFVWTTYETIQLPASVTYWSEQKIITMINLSSTEPTYFFLFFFFQIFVWIK